MFGRAAQSGGSGGSGGGKRNAEEGAKEAKEKEMAKRTSYQVRPHLQPTEESFFVME
jgi:hypothetical protein